MSTVPSAAKLPPAMEQLLRDLVEAAQRCFGANLRSVILFGSGAEGRLRATSDLNLMLVLRQFEQAQVDALREPLRVAQVAAQVAVMFVLEAELPAAADAFAVKFDDLGRRRRVLFGDDVIAGLTVSAQAKRRRLQQVLMNLVLRLRQQYALLSLREEQLAGVIAEAVGPLRSAAATLLELEGQPVASPKEALERVVAGCDPAGSPQLPRLTELRQSRQLPAGTAGTLLFTLMAWAEAMRLRAAKDA